MKWVKSTFVNEADLPYVNTSYNKCYEVNAQSKKNYAKNINVLPLLKKITIVN